MTTPVPPHILNVLTSLKEAGYRSWLVGGAVRDMVLGRDRADFDIATPATPEQVTAIFPKAIPTGIEHGTVTVVVGKDPVEITTFRGDGAYSDGRRPDSVTFLTSIEEDLARRDFTINAMAFDPLTGDFCDPFDGREDARRSRLRAVRDAHERFNEDGLRIMRLFRFQGELGFHIEATTLQAAQDCRSMLYYVAEERKTKEILRLLGAKHAVHGLTDLIETGIIMSVIPEVNAMAPMAICENVPRENVAARLAAVLFPHTAHTGEGATRTVCERMKLSSAMTEDVVKYLHGADDLVVAQGSMLTPYAARQWAAKVHPERVDGALAVARVYRDKMNAMEESILTALNGNPPLFVSDLKVNGNDMKALGLQGKQIGVVLKFLLDSAMKDPAVNTREGLLALVEAK